MKETQNRREYDFPRWLNLYKTRPSTRHTYLYGVKAFLNRILATGITNRTDS